MNKPIKKTVVFIGYDCNNNCRFCMEQNVRREASQKKEEVMAEMLKAKSRGSDYLEIIGGEATIRPDFLDIVRFARKLKFQTVMIATNGRMFSYKKKAYEAIEAGLNSVVFSIHGHNAKIHDYLTRVPGSFNQLQQGIKNIKVVTKELGVKIHIGTNTTIVKQNYKHLPKIGKLIKSFGIKNSEFIFVDCNEGGAYNNFFDLVPRISDAAPYIHKCLDLYNPKDERSNWDIRYVPLCYFTDYLGQVSELREKKIFKTDQVGRGAIGGSYDYQEKRKNFYRVKPEKCAKCILYQYCEGVWRFYYKKYGGKELKPVLKITEEQEKKLKEII